MNLRDSTAEADAAGVAVALPAPRTAKRPYVIFALVALALMMSSLDQTIVATALHALQQDLGASLAWASWTMTIYALGMVVMVPVAGKLAEQYGRRRVFMASVALFTVASLLCGLATNIYVLVTLRFFQALGGAGFTPAGTGIIVDYFGPARDRAVGLFGSLFSLGAMIGPIFGGFFVTYWSWRGVFFVNVPVGLVLAALCLRYIPRDPPGTAGQAEDLDVPGMCALGVGVLGIMLALNVLAGGGGALASVAFGAPALVAIVAITWFLRHIGASAHPFIPRAFLLGNGFGAVNLVNVIGGVIEEGLLALVPVYAIVHYGISPLAAGTLLTGEALGLMLMSGVGVMLLRRGGYRLPIYIGTTAMALGVIGLAGTPSGVSPYAWLVGVTCVIGLGAGLVSPASRNAGLKLAPQHTPTLAALRTLCFQVGAIGSISVTAAIIAGAADATTAHASAYIGWGVLVLILLPVVSRIPEHHGAW